MDTIQLDTTVRTKTGKGPARKLRSEGRIPAIFYGPKADPVMLSLDYVQLKKMLKEKSAESIIFDLRIDSGKKSQSRKVMIKEIQKDPVTRDYLHIDLYEIAMEKELEVDVPVFLINTPIGVDKGGVLQQVRRELGVSCLPKNLVDRLDIDVSGLDIGQTLHIEDISFPPGVKTTEDSSLTIATVVAPTITPEAEEEAKEEVGEIEGEEIEGEEES